MSSKDVDDVAEIEARLIANINEPYIDAGGHMGMERDVRALMKELVERATEIDHLKYELSIALDIMERQAAGFPPPAEVYFIARDEIKRLLAASPRAGGGQ